MTTKAYDDYVRLGVAPQLTSADLAAPILLTITHGPTKFAFRYSPGDEAAVIDALIELVHAGVGFDWFDAMVVSNMVGRRLAKELKTMKAVT